MRALLLLLCLLSLGAGAQDPVQPVIESKGYTVGEQAGQDFRVVLGHAPQGTQAFFFWRDLYLGTDALEPSAQVKIGRVEPDTITLVYGLYRSQDQDQPSAGTCPVRFHCFEKHLTAMDPLPPSGILEPVGRR